MFRLFPLVLFIVFCLQACIGGLMQEVNRTFDSLNNNELASTAADTEYSNSENAVSSEYGFGEKNGLRKLAVKVSYGNIRSKPSTRSSIIAVMKNGSLLDLVEKKQPDSNWFHVRLPDGRTGWAHKILFAKKDTDRLTAKNRSTPKGDPLQRSKNPSSDSSELSNTQQKNKKTASPSEEDNFLERTAENDKYGNDVPAADNTEPALNDDTDAKVSKKDKPLAASAVITASVGDSGNQDLEKQTGKEKKFIVISNCEMAEIYSDPNVFASKTGQVPKGQKVEYLDTVDNFYKILHDGKQGYVYKDFGETIK